MLQGWPVLGNGNRAAAHATAACSSDDAIATIRSQKGALPYRNFSITVQQFDTRGPLFATFSHTRLETYERAVGEFERRHGVHVQFQYADWNSLQSRLQNAMLARSDVPDMHPVMLAYRRDLVEKLGIDVQLHARPAG
jgi:ABC-type glycerol-3-phosphate transport system substrate-binding protein